MPASPTLTDYAVAAALGIAVAIVYAMGASPSIYVGDSGELVAAVGTLGIPHPTGYPLYVMLGKLFTLAVPVGSIAYRMSLFSVVCAAVACATVYLTARRIGLRPAAALLAALLAAFGASFWSQANIQRVYALNGLFVALATLLAFAWHDTRRLSTLAGAFFVCGLGACNHTFMALYAFALGVFMLTVEPRLLIEPVASLRRFAAIALPFAAGLLPYAYLPIRSRMNPRLDWGDPETLRGFLDVVLRRDFWERAWMESPADALTVAADFVATLGVETTWAGALLAAVAIATAWRAGRPVLLCVIVIVVNVGAMALHGSRSDIFIWHRYYIPSYLMLAILAGMAWDGVAARLDRRVSWVALVLPLVLFAGGYASYDRSRFYIAEDFANAVLESLPPGANLIATDDNVLFVLIYLTLVEGARPDVNLILQGVGKADLPPLRFNPETDPLYFTHHPNWDLPALEIIPLGVVYRAWERGKPPPPVVVPRSELAGEHDDRVPKDYLTQNLLGHFHYTLGFTFESRDWPRAREEFANAARAAAHNDVLFYNLGLVFSRNGLWDDAVQAFARSHEINPRHLASLSKPRAASRLAQAVAERDRVAAIEREIAAQLGDDMSKGTAEYHLRMAEALETHGEALAARGRRLRAAEIAYNKHP